MKYEVKKGSAQDRLPTYYCYFKMLQEQNISNVSSDIIRQDFGFLSCNSIVRDLKTLVPSSGRRNYGYNVNFICSSLSQLLGIDNGCCYFVIGDNYLSNLIIQNKILEKADYYYAATITDDMSDEKIAEYMQNMNIRMLILTEQNHALVQKLLSFGITGIIDFTEDDSLEVPEHISVERFNILSFFTELSLKMVRKIENLD